MSINDVLKSLQEVQRRQLLVAFENEYCEYLEYKKDHFVGVNIRGIPNLVIVESVGDWAIGTITKGESDASPCT